MLPRRVQGTLLILAAVSFVCFVLLVMSGRGFTQRVVATVAVRPAAGPSPMLIEWASEPTIREDGIVQMAIHVLRPDPLSWVYFDTVWFDGGRETCSAPLSAPEIRCQFDPKNYGVKPGAMLALEVSVENFNGGIVQTLPTYSVVWGEPARSRGYVLIGVALVVGVTLLAVALYRRRAR